MDTKKFLHIAAFTLLLIGGLNWGLIGLDADWDLFFLLLPQDGSLDVVGMVVQTLIGVSAVYILFAHKGDCKVCGGK